MQTKTYFKYFLLSGFFIAGVFWLAGVSAQTTTESASGGAGISLHPPAITDLTVLEAAEHSVKLSWTVPYSQTIANSDIYAYKLRYGAFYITENTWFEAIYAPSPFPGLPGAEQTAVIEGLQPSTTYYFAIKTMNEQGFQSVLSNVVEAATLEPPPADEPPASGGNTSLASISGAITNYAGEPVSGAFVDLHTSDFSFSRGAMSDAQGYYFIGELEPGHYVVKAHSPENTAGLIEPFSLDIDLLIEEAMTHNFQFSQGSKTIRGKVVYADGMAVSNVEVSVFREDAPGWADSAVDIEGNYSLRMGGGRWQASIRPRDPETADWTFTYPPKQINFALDQTEQEEIVDFTVKRADGMVKGRVLKPDGSLPTPYQTRVIISASYGFGNEGGLDNQGNFAVAVPAGSYTISIFSGESTLGAPNIEPFSVSFGQTLDLGAIKLIQRTELIKGKVIDEQGRGVANVEVETFQPGGAGFSRTTTDQFGNYQLSVSSGEWLVSVATIFAPQYVYTEPLQRIVVEPGETMTVNFTLSAASAVIAGRVEDESGNLLTDVYGWAFAEKETIDIERMKGGSSLGGPIERGKFSFNAPSGRYKVNMHLPPDADYGPGLPVSVVVGAGQTANIVLKVKSNDGAIKGFLKDEAGNVLTGVFAHIFVSGENGLWQEGQIDMGQGSYLLRVSPGKWYLGFHVESSTGYLPGRKFEESIEISQGQSIERDVTLIKADAVISGTVSNAQGEALSNVWVSADAQSFFAESMEDVMESEDSPKHFSNQGGETDRNGKFSFLVSQGVYYLHAFLPPEFGYINPEEQKVAVVPGGAANIELIFRQKDSIIAGAVFLNSQGAPAFVWAWSDKGGFSEGKADEQGNYKLNVVKNDVWHIGAVKKIGKVPYKSDEAVIDMGAQELVKQDLILKGMNIEMPESVSVTTEAASPRVVSVPKGARVSLPGNALATQGNVTLTLDPAIELPSQGISKVVGVGYNIEARDQQGKTIESFNTNVTVSLPYTEDYLREAKVSVDDLELGFWDKTSARWNLLDNSVVDKNNYLVVGSTNHFTRFAIVAPADVTPPKPPSNITVSSFSANSLLLAWQNPTNDFHHIKIYRSQEQGQRGSIVFNEVLGASQEDTGLEQGKTYFYIIRAVDPAGNESTNVKQISGAPQEGAVEEPAETEPTEPSPESALKPISEMSIEELKAEIVRITGLILQIRSLLAETKGEAVSQLTDNLKYGDSSEQVKLLQRLLAKPPVGGAQIYPEALITGYFGQLTLAAVVIFQEKYADEVLEPIGLSKGTGFVGFYTIKKINELLTGE